MPSFELGAVEPGKSPVTVATASQYMKSEGLTSRHRRDVEARESTRNADEAVLARFGKKQQLTVGIMLLLGL